jgi:macrolide transport system ATP-binding/permease protein
MIHRFTRVVLLRLRSLFRRDAVEGELDDELRAFADELTARGRASGLGEAEARAAALRQMGSMVRVKEETREAWGITRLDELRRDARYAIRALGRSPGFAAVAILTMAVGVGASTAIFSQINAVFLTALPVERPEDLRVLQWNSAASELPRRYGVVGRFSFAAYVSLRDRSRSFSDVACWSDAFSNLGTETRLVAQIVSGNYFRTLGATPLIGRVFGPADEREGARVAVLGHALWQRAFGGDPSVLGRNVPINREVVTVVGVMPERFFGVNPARAADIYMSMPMYESARFDGLAPRRLTNDRDWSACEVVARIRPGVSDETAAAEARELVAASPHAFQFRPDMPRQLTVTPAAYGLDDLRLETSRSLWILMATTGLLLVIACANVAGLLLARAPDRAHEIGTRLALGASRARVIRQLTVEGMVLVGIAGTAGIAVAHGLNRILPGVLRTITASGADVARVQPETDWRVLAFAAGTTLLTSLVLGLVPAFHSTRVDLRAVIADVPGGGGSRRFLTRKLLVAAQVALAFPLLVAAALFAQTVMNLRDRLEVADSVLVFSASPGHSGYMADRLERFFEAVVTRLDQIPGATSGSGSATTTVCVPSEGREEIVGATAISPRHFETFGVPLIEGRDVRWSDGPGAPAVALVNQAFVRRYLPDARLGDRLEFCRGHRARTLIGIVADRRANPRQDYEPAVFMPLLQPSPPVTGNQVTFAVRAAGAPRALDGAVRDALASVDSLVPVFDLEAGAERRARAFPGERTLSGLLTVFGGVALLLACLGTYGVVAATVRRRTVEVGIRMALGADRREVVALIVRDSLLPVGVGLLVGVAAALASARLVEAMLFGVTATDARILTAAAVVIAAVATAASFLPARRASRINPVRALRQSG